MFFTRDSADLTPSDRAALDAYAQAYTRQAASVQVTVDAYASIDGQDQHNRTLSVARARSVASYLASKGIPAQNIRTAGHGETDAFSSGDPRPNRRATIAPRMSAPTGSPAPAASPAPATPSPTPPPPSASPMPPATHSPAPPPASPAQDPARSLPISVEIPIDGPEVPAFNGKIKIKWKGKITIDAMLGDGKSPLPVTVTVNTSKGYGLKFGKSWWDGKASVQLGGVDVVISGKFETKGTINAKEVEAKAEYSVTTPIGTVTLKGVLFKWTYGKEPEAGAVELSLKEKAKVGDTTIDDVPITHITVTVEIGAEIAPQYLKIIADAVMDEMKAAAERGGAQVATDAALGFAIEAGLIVVAIGVVAGTYQSLAQAGDERELVAQTSTAKNMFQTGIDAALNGKPSPGSSWFAFGWAAGNKVFADAVAKAKQNHPDWSDDDIRDKVISQASRLGESAEVKATINRIVGQQFWSSWVAGHHGLGTFLGDAKTACGICFGIPIVSNDDPHLDEWRKVSSLPDIMKS